MSICVSKVSSGEAYGPPEVSAKPKILIAIAIILGIGGFAVAGVGVASLFKVGSLSNLGQVNAIVMIAVGGGGGALCFIAAIVGIVKNWAPASHVSKKKSQTSAKEEFPTLRVYSSGPTDMMDHAFQTVEKIARAHFFNLKRIHIELTGEGIRRIKETCKEGIRSSVVILDSSLLSRFDAVRNFEDLYESNSVQLTLVETDLEDLQERFVAGKEYPVLQSVSALHYTHIDECTFLEKSEATLHEFFEKAPREATFFQKIF